MTEPMPGVDPDNMTSRNADPRFPDLSDADDERGGDDRFDGEQLDLADRQALRRVAGLSTELQDVTEVEYRQLRLERVVLIGVWTEGIAATPRTPWPSSPRSPRPPAPWSSRG